MPHVAIIGAGITGVTTAYSLLKRGFRVTLFERHRYPAMETSFANGGQLSASNAEVWNRPSTILHGLRWMLRSDAPLLFNPMPSWHKYSWIAEFIAQVANYKKNTIETTRLAIAARKCLLEIAETEQIDFDLENKGILHLYSRKLDFDAATQANILMRQGGLERFAVNPAEMRRIEPTLVGDYYGGYFTPSDATGDIHKFTRGLAAVCVKLGATLQCDTLVEEIDPRSKVVSIKYGPAYPKWTRQGYDKIDVDSVVICAGVESRRLATSLGDRINIYPVKGYSISVHLDDERSRNAAPRVSILDDHRKIVTSRLGLDRFRIAGTAEFSGFNRDIRDDRVKPLVQWVHECFPDVATDRVVPWSGLRPMTPDMLPRVGSGRKRGVFYNTGHGHLGWTLAAATADIIADKIARASS